MASSMIAVNRNIRKAEVQKGLTGKMTKDQIDDVMNEPDTFVEVLKERATGEYAKYQPLLQPCDTVCGQGKQNHTNKGARKCLKI